LPRRSSHGGSLVHSSSLERRQLGDSLQLGGTVQLTQQLDE